MKIQTKVHFLFLSLLIVPFGPMTAEAKLKVVTTLPSFADIASRVGGEDVEASALTKGYQDPHFVDPKPNIILELNKASLLIRAGLGLEDSWLTSLVTGSRNGKIQTGSDGHLDVSTLMTLQEIPKGTVDRSQGDVHPGGNPHYMLDPKNGVVLAKALAIRLGKLDPARAETYKNRAEAYASELIGKISEWQKALAPLKGSRVVTYHRSWVYFSNWVGLDEVGYVEPKPGIPPSPDHIAKLIPLIREKKAKWILIEPYYPKGSAEEVAKQTKVPLHTLPTEVHGVPEVKSYSDVFDFITKKLTAASGS